MNAGLLAGDTALVTGAANGIGRAVGVALAREGARVVLADTNADGGEAAASAIRAEGHDATFVAADLRTRDGARALFADALRILGTLSILVHSASPRRREQDTAAVVDDATWDAMVGVNLVSGFTLGRLACEHMRERGVRGRALFVTSLHAEAPRNLPHYSASKAGMTMVMKELARAYGPHGIRVNALAPGAIPGGGFVADVEALTKKIAMGRMGTPEDCAGAAVALLCDRFCGYVTGTTVVVDGGLALYNWIPAAS
jgi:NAD(P)-dependent dehydrogenase (short-subunit alcohol dehydrogenase family)